MAHRKDSLSSDTFVQARIWLLSQKAAFSGRMCGTYFHRRKKIVVEEKSLLQSSVPTVQGYSAGESTETQSLFENELRE